MKLLFKLLFAFMKIGLFTFGGGYAMLPMVKKEIVEHYKWATDEEVLDMFAIGQCTPGIIAVNTATFIGYKVKGVLGAIFATIGVVLPNIIIITIITTFLYKYRNNEYVTYAFNGIMAIIAALIVQAVIKLWKTGIKDLIGIALFVIAFVFVAFTKFSPVYMVLFGALVGLFVRREK